MKFNGGKFKILVLSDLHTPHKMPKLTRLFCERMVGREKPDLIVLLGDNTAGNYPLSTASRTEKAVREVLSLVGEIPFALVFGNHDHEGLPKLDEITAKKHLLSIYREKPGCMAIAGDKSLHGVGNYRIPLTNDDGKEIFSLFFLDSGTYLNGGYSSVRENQIAWFEGECAAPSIVFQHIVPEEIYSCFHVSDTPKKGYVKGQCDFSARYYKPVEKHLISGSLKEGPCPGKVNFGQFESWKKSGKVLAGVFGHDHVNDFDILHEGIRLLNSPSPSFYTYGNNRGVRTITIYEDRPEAFDTAVYHYDTEMTQRPLNPFVHRYGIATYRQQILPCLLGGIGIGAAAITLIGKVTKK